MISRAHKFALAATLLALPLTNSAAPSKAASTAPQEKVQSTFTIPKSPDEGHDPFFPKATSIYVVAESSKPAVVVQPGISLLKVNGLLGSSLATINNVTLSVGETAEVKTTSGAISVRLVEIHAADGSVVIEANGQRRVLNFNAR